jgi:hypothetical protein
LLIAVGSIYFIALLRQLIKVYGRYHYNVMANMKGNVLLPSIVLYPNISPKIKKCLRIILIISLLLFAIFSIVAMIISAKLAGNIEFWHVWGWFGY